MMLWKRAKMTQKRSRTLHWLLWSVFWGTLLIAPLQELGAATPGEGLAIVFPPDRVWVSQKTLFLTGTTEAKEDQTQEVVIHGVKTEGPSKITPKGGGFGVMLRLAEGLNAITVRTGKLEENISIFYLPPEQSKAKSRIPAGYRKWFIHADPGLLECGDCHRQKRGTFDYQRMIPSPADCTSGKCHSELGKDAHVHGPVGAGVCISCHNPHGSFQPLQLARSGRDLCFVCHQAKAEEFAQEIVHFPVQEGCTDCHDPHGSPMRYQLRGDGNSLSSLCFRCHEQAMFTKSHRHGPVAVGDCIACHQPHASQNQYLLIASRQNGQLCFYCHQDRKAGFTKKHLHPPVEEDCSQCHDPHSSQNRFQLHHPREELCKTCHQDLHPQVFTDIDTAQYSHPPAAKGDCAECHDIHSSNHRGFLRDSLERLCLSCHLDLGDEIVGAKYKHGPVQTGDCNSCHAPHGSEYTKLLVRFFPTSFYSEYQPEIYDLCFGCHNKDIAKTKFTSTLTSFRDGEYNLHFFHVNMKKGRTCTACHDPHASNQAKHVRYEVPFGAWSYPIELTKTNTGGTCVVGCHAPKTYDRKQPTIKPSR